MCQYNIGVDSGLSEQFRTVCLDSSGEEFLMGFLERLHQVVHGVVYIEYKIYRFERGDAAHC